MGLKNWPGAAKLRQDKIFLNRAGFDLDGIEKLARCAKAYLLCQIFLARYIHYLLTDWPGTVFAKVPKFIFERNFCLRQNLVFTKLSYSNFLNFCRS